MNYDELPVARQYGNVDNYNKSDLQPNSVNHAWSHSHHFMQMNASTVCSAPQSNEKVTFIVIM